jgi:predicted metal-dependent hydrolase
MTTAATPADLRITPRDLKFNRVGGQNAALVSEQATQNGANSLRWWHGGDPIKTAFYNALSMTFPQGESLFIEAVRRFREQANPLLQTQIAAFIKQETLHTREHVVFNRLVEQGGYDVKGINAYVSNRMRIARERSPLAQLAITVALEHFTAILAHGLLSDPKHLQGAPAEAAKLWRWHAIEEIEHKGVAFDTYVAATQNRSDFRRWYIRCKAMAFISYVFWRSNARHMADFFRQDGMNTPLTWLRVLKFHFVSPGMLSKVFLEYWKFYLPGFHPWNTDDRALIADAERSLQEESAAA